MVASLWPFECIHHKIIILNVARWTCNKYILVMRVVTVCTYLSPHCSTCYLAYYMSASNTLFIYNWRTSSFLHNFVSDLMNERPLIWIHEHCFLHESITDTLRFLLVILRNDICRWHPMSVLCQSKCHCNPERLFLHEFVTDMMHFLRTVSADPETKLRCEFSAGTTSFVPVSLSSMADNNCRSLDLCKLGKPYGLNTCVIDLVLITQPWFDDPLSMWVHCVLDLVLITQP